MFQLLGAMWGLIGIVLIFAARPFTEVFCCFFLYAMFYGVVELHEIRKAITGFTGSLKPMSKEEVLDLMRDEETNNE